MIENDTPKKYVHFMKGTGVKVELWNLDMLKMANTISPHKFGKNTHFFKKNHQKETRKIFSCFLFGGFFLFY